MGEPKKSLWCMVCIMRSLILAFANVLLLSLHSQQQRLEQIHSFRGVGFLDV